MGFFPLSFNAELPRENTHWTAHFSENERLVHLKKLAYTEAKKKKRRTVIYFKKATQFLLGTVQFQALRFFRCVVFFLHFPAKDPLKKSEVCQAW